MNIDVRNVIVDGKYLETLGKIVHNTQAIELQLASIAWDLMEAEQDVGRMATTVMSVRQLLDFVSALAHHRLKGDDLNDALGLITEAGTIDDRRNAAIHSVYAIAGDGRQVRIKSKVRRKKPLALDEVYTPIEELGKVVNDSANLCSSLVSFAERVKHRTR